MKKILDYIKKELKEIVEYIKSGEYNFLFFWDPRFTIDNEKWRLHNFDADQNYPSVPHMDGVTDTRKKLNIYTGEIFLKNNKKCIGKASKKEFKRLWDDFEFREIVYKERIRYIKKFGKEPEHSIPDTYIEEYMEIRNKKIKS